MQEDKEIELLEMHRKVDAVPQKPPEAKKPIYWGQALITAMFGGTA